MDKQYIEDNEIGIKYLRQQLNPEEMEAFEIYLMENPEAFESIQCDSMLHEGVSKPAELEESNVVLNSSIRWKQNVVSFLSGGTLMAMLFAVFSGHFITTESNVPYFAVVQSNERGVDLSRDQFEVINVPKTNSEIALLITTDKFESSTYDVVIEDAGDQLAKYDRVSSNENGEIVVVVSEDWLDKELTLSLLQLNGVLVKQHRLLIKTE